jgi:hypothetical protein
LVLTSPPYWSLRSYQTEPVIWGTDATVACNHDFVSRSYKLHSGRGDLVQKVGKYSQQVAIPIGKCLIPLASSVGLGRVN